MATHTVTQPTANGSSTRVKNESGLWGWLFGRSAEAEAADPQPFAPSDQSKWLLSGVRHVLGEFEAQRQATAEAERKRVAASPTDLDGSHPAYLLRHLAMLALDGEIDPALTFRGAVEKLRSAWDLLNERADAQDTIDRRTAAAVEVIHHVTRTIAETVDTEQRLAHVTGGPVALELNTAAIGDGLAALQANAHSPLDDTMQFPRITAALPSHTFPPSPVHVPLDAVSPPIPAGPVAAAPLPQRHPHIAVMAAPVGPDGGPLHGRRVDPREAPLAGAWVFYGGGSGPVYRQAEGADADGDAVRITYRNGDEQTVRRDATVRVLSEAEALELLAGRETAGGVSA